MVVSPAVKSVTQTKTVSPQLRQCGTREKGGWGGQLTRNKMDGENGTQNEELTNPTTPMNVASPSQEHMREIKTKELRPRLSYTWFSQRWQQSHVLNVVGSENTCPSTGEHCSECTTDRSVTNTVPQKHTSIESFLLTLFPRTHFLLEMVCL